ncbi:MAG: Cobyrinic acid a,c-diamide synthetase [uncultured Lysobacter sp.]|uniref:Cobyrinic acid a,c-diamide synthetase n=1 Tax=uncultured Lysobacter sp. TaxID=271060 RepID=A0A6J4KRH0_9GAMM|nr:MAG: Cobyrinic acid a,c-diamide synthetase [uncultured Lysobacter sp.]
MDVVRHCPALLVSAPASGQGKTSVTAALARWHRNQGRRVRVFKTGPDFLDPLLLARANGGEPVYQLDLWMTGEADVRARLYEAAGDSDLILVEGVMGLFDGDPSSADLAMQLGLPVMAVIDGSAMAQTFGALALGLARYRQGLSMFGVAANRIGSARHAGMLRDSLPTELAWLGALPRDAALALPERHLGLVVADELGGIDARLDALAEAWAQHASTELPPPSMFQPATRLKAVTDLHGVRIAIARDAAFCFLYPANLDLLREAGAELRFFSPLAGDALPGCDAVWLPGGYPELHLPVLAQRDDLRAALRAHRDAGKPLLAECGGLLYALDTLAGRDGAPFAMAGLLPGTAVMQSRFVALGMQEVELPEGTLRGHTFHYGCAEIAATPLTLARNPNGGPSAEAVYRDRRMTASFVHLYFPSNPDAALALLRP